MLQKTKTCLVLLLALYTSNHIYGEKIHPEVTALFIEIQLLSPGQGFENKDFLDYLFKFHVTITIKDLATVKGNIRKVEVIDDFHNKWTIDHNKYIKVDKNQVGGIGFWSMGSKPGEGTTFDSGWRVRITLLDGSSNDTRFTMAPPDWVSAQEKKNNLLIFTNPSYRGPQQAGLIPTLDPPVATEVYRKDGLLRIKMLYNGPAIQTATFYFYDDAYKYLGYYSTPNNFPISPGGDENDRKNYVELTIPEDQIRATEGSNPLTYTSVKVLASTYLTKAQADQASYTVNYRSDLYLVSPNPGETPRLANKVIAAHMETQKKVLAQQPQGLSKSEREEAWAIGLGSINSQIGGLNRDGLAFKLDRSEMLSEMNQSYETSWNFGDHDSFISTMEDLWSKGHNKSYQAMRTALLADPKISTEDMKKKIQPIPVYEDRMAIVKSQLGENGLDSIRAWDLGRMVNLTRYAMMRNFISKDEAKGWLGKIAQEAQKNYGSWEEWGAEFAFGRMFWSGQPDGKENWYEATKAVHILLSPGGYWFNNPWPSPEGAEVDMKETME